jgi:tetratricopeptide (TPR) repeat protein
MNIYKAIQTALQYHQEGNLQQAANICIDILEIQPDHVVTLHFLGVICYQLRNYDFAITCFEKALQFNPTYTDTYYNLGCAYQRKGQFNQAIDSFQKAIQLNPSFADAYKNIANILLETGQLDDAIACYQKALQLNPNNAINLSMILSERLKQHFNNIETILNIVGESVEGNLICDITPNNYVIDSNQAKISNLHYLAKDKNKICEIGVNSGNSLLIMLDSNPNAEYLLFDLNNHKYTQPCIEYIKKQYPNTKITIIYGDSKETMPKFLEENPNEINTYDLIHIDGGHNDMEVQSDYLYSNKLGCGQMIFDDYDYLNIQMFIDSEIKNNKIVKVKDSNLIDTKLHIVYTLTLLMG